MHHAHLSNHHNHEIKMTSTFFRPARALTAIAFALAASTTMAANLTLLCAGAMKPSISELLAKRAASEPKVDVTYATAGAIREKIAKGEKFDVVIAPSDVTADFMKQQLIDAKTRHPLGQTEIGIAVKQGAPIPDIKTPAGLKATLLAAKKIVIVAPDKGTSGRLLVAMFKDMGIYDQLEPKLIQVDGGTVTEAVAHGEADLGFQQVSEILVVKGVTLAGTLPGDLKKLTRYDLAMMNSTTNKKDAEALVRELSTPEAHKVVEKSGFSPAL
jgi:molybdate transport system substrate-binding protein